MNEELKKVAKTNEFVAHAAEIREICIRENVDKDVGLDMYVAEHGIERNKDMLKKYNEFRDLCRKYTLRGMVKALKDNEVRA